MAASCLYLKPDALLGLSPRACLWKLVPSRFHGGRRPELGRGGSSWRRGKMRQVAVASVHSNPRILKTNRRTPFGLAASPYDEEEEEDIGEEGEEDDDEVESDFSDICFPVYVVLCLSNTCLLSDAVVNQFRQLCKESVVVVALSLCFALFFKSFCRCVCFEVKTSYQKQSRLSSGNDNNRKKGVWRMSKSVGVEKNAKKSKKDLKVENDKIITKTQFRKLSEELELDEKLFPLIDYLSRFGLKKSDFIQMYERHMPCLQINVVSARERLEFLLGVGVKKRDIRKILIRQPQILEYTVEKNLKAHVSFLVSIGVPDSRVGQIITAAPSLLSYSVEKSLKPTIRYLIEEVGIKTSDVSKVVQLSPQILVQRIDNSWTTRFGFFSRELGAPKDSIVKMVTKHPQLLHYSIEDGISPRINFLRSIGMRDSDIVKVLTSLTQVLSLSLEDNLRPKYLYLVNELHNEVKSLTKYPMYFSLSLEQRIRPRHRFLVALKKAPKGPFPLSSFVPTDECFCQQWAGTSLDKYLAFRQSLLLSQFAKKYKKE